MLDKAKVKQYVLLYTVAVEARVNKSSNFKALHFIVSLVVSFARNADVFEGRFIPPFLCFSAQINILLFVSYITLSKAILERQLFHDFDGASQGFFQM